MTGGGAVVWLTGLPGAGKSTLATRLATRLRDARRPVLVLDGDALRDAIVPAPGYDAAARDGFYATLGNLAVMAARQGLIAVVAATAHRRAWRDAVRRAAPRFVEVHVATPLDECRRRDPKGLYAAAPATLPGATETYEPPVAPEAVAPLGDDVAVIDAVLALLGVGGL